MNVYEEGRIVKGIKDNLKIVGNPDEIRISEIFSRLFGITFSRIDFFKNKEYPFNFLSPGESLRTTFNMGNEILILFDRSTSFDTRCFDFIDKTAQEYKNRIDNICVIIVSKDISFVEKIKSYSSEQKDSRIVVPFVYSDFNFSVNDNFILEKFRSFLFTRNLFSVESPLTSDLYFFGREKQVHTLYTKFTLGQHAGLFGLRKSGKTSVLFAVERRIKLDNSYSIYLDCQNPSIYQKRWFELLQFVIDSVTKKYNNLYFVKTSDYTEKNASEKFEIELLHLFKEMNNKRILLIFDEIEHISFDTSIQEHWRNGFDYIKFWQTIRSIYQSHPYIFSFIIAGVNPSIIESPIVLNIDNPIFAMLESFYLELFTTENVKNMITNLGGYMGIEFHHDLFTKLTEDYGGHPFLIRNVCSLISSSIDKRPFFVDKSFYSIRKKEFDRKIQPYLESILGILKSWYPSEFEYLRKISSLDSSSGILKSYNVQINHLLGYGIITENEDHLFISIDAIKLYLNSQEKIVSYPSDIETRWTNLSISRNNLELNLRRVVKLILVTKVGKKGIIDVLLSIKTEDDRKKLNSCSLDKLLTDHYFFLDIQKLIEKRWDDFSNIFIDKLKFSMCMDTVNKLRADAHAKDIIEEDFVLFSYSIKWLESKIEEIMINYDN